MKYVGSKNRLSKDLAPIIQSYITNETEGYLEPFVGGANMIDKIKCNKKIGTDNHKYLIAVLKKLSEGWIPPEEITEEKYKDIKNNKKKISRLFNWVCWFSTFIWWKMVWWIQKR